MRRAGPESTSPISYWVGARCCRALAWALQRPPSRRPVRLVHQCRYVFRACGPRVGSRMLHSITTRFGTLAPKGLAARVAEYMLYYGLPGRGAARHEATGDTRLAATAHHYTGGSHPMGDGVYRVTELIGVSGESWEAAARNAVETAARTVRDLRVAEVIREDVTIENGSIINFRVRLAISFKYETE